MTAIADDIRGIADKVETALKGADTEATAEYQKLKANPEIALLLPVLGQVADAELPAGVVSAAGDVFKMLVSFGQKIPAPAAPAAPAVPAVPVEVPAEGQVTPTPDQLMGIKTP